MLINRGKGICALGLVLGTGGIGLATIASSASGHAGSWSHRGGGAAAWAHRGDSAPAWAHRSAAPAWSHGGGAPGARGFGHHGSPAAPAAPAGPARAPQAPAGPAPAPHGAGAGHRFAGSHAGGARGHGHAFGRPANAPVGPAAPAAAPQAAQTAPPAPGEHTDGQGGGLLPPPVVHTHTTQGNGSTQVHNGAGQGGHGHTVQGGCGSCQRSQSSSLGPQGSNPVSLPITTTHVQTVGPGVGILPTTGTTGLPGNTGLPSSSTSGLKSSTSNLIAASSLPLTKSTTTGSTPKVGPFGPGLAGVTGTTTAGAAAGAVPAFTAAAGTAGTTGTGATGTTTATAHATAHAHRSANPNLRTAPTAPNVIQRIEHVVPGFVWLALAASLALAAVGGASALIAGRRVRRQAGQFAAVTAAALTDPLTGVLNRRGFLEAMERELARARRYGLPFVLAYVDVRGLKAVNDSEGHLAGDELLKEAAHLLKDSARADDVVGRIGGDEMGLLLVEQGPEGAQTVMRRITSQLPARRAALGISSNWDLTVGTASFPEDGSTVNELLATADRRLYEQRGIALR